MGGLGGLVSGGAARGVLPSQLIREAIALGYIHADGEKVPEDREPASLDLRLGRLPVALQLCRRRDRRSQSIDALNASAICAGARCSSRTAPT